MKRNRILQKAVPAVLMLGMVFMGCQDESWLETKNINQPDESRALAEAGDVESLIKGSVVKWFSSHTQYGYEHLIVAADVMSCSWGNYGMKYTSSEPRLAFPNNTSYRYVRAVEDNWYDMYKAISAANDGLRAIEGGLQIGDGGADNVRAKAFGKLVQGLAHGVLACFYDKAFIFDETINLDTDVLEMKPYGDVMTAAIAQLTEAASLADANTFTIDNWFNGLTLTNEDVSKIAHSFIARYMAQVARTAADRAAVDWSSVQSHAAKGVTDALSPHGAGGYGDWWHSGQWFHNDYKFVGGADESTGYKDWLATDVQLRTEWVMEVSDLRITTGEDTDEDGLPDPGSYAGTWTGSPFRANRGTYHFSRYGYHRYENFALSGNTDPMPVMTPAELDFLVAEGYLHQGNGSAAAELIDKYHVTNGGYASSASASVGSITDPMGPIDGDVSKGTLWSILKYNKLIEVVQTGAGIEFYDVRGWGDLTANTPVHWPVPAKELGVLQQEIYTFGGCTSVSDCGGASGNSATPREYHGPPAGPH